MRKTIGSLNSNSKYSLAIKSQGERPMLTKLVLSNKIKTLQWDAPSHYRSAKNSENKPIK